MNPTTLNIPQTYCEFRQWHADTQAANETRMQELLRKGLTSDKVIGETLPNFESYFAAIIVGIHSKPGTNEIESIQLFRMEQNFINLTTAIAIASALYTQYCGMREATKVTEA